MFTIYEDRKTKLDLKREHFYDLQALKDIWNPQDFSLEIDGTILLKHYVGFVSHRKTKLQILPKIYEVRRTDELDKERDEAMHLLFRLLHFSEYAYVKKIPKPEHIRQYRGDMLEIFIYIFALRFLKLFEREIHRRYEPITENMQFIKGKIDFQESIRKNLYKKHLHYLRFDELTLDTILNQIIKKVMTILLLKTNSSVNKKNLKQALTYLEEVKYIRLSKTVFDKVYFNRLNESYRPLFNMAKMFYHNYLPGFHAGDENTFTFLIPLNDLFEYFIYKLLARSSLKYNVFYQKPQLKLAQRNGKGEFTLKPDITITDDGKVKAILDAKYKNPTKDINQSDVYQMLAYSFRYRCSNLFLVYPSFEEEEGQMPVKVLSTYRISNNSDDIKLNVIQVNIRDENIELLQDELREILLQSINYL